MFEHPVERGEVVGEVFADQLALGVELDGLVGVCELLGGFGDVGDQSNLEAEDERALACLVDGRG